MHFVKKYQWLTLPSVMLLHLFLCWIGLQVPVFNDHVSMIWPASGFAFAVIWRLGFVYMLPVAVSVLCLTTLQGNELATAVGFALGSSVGPAVAVWLIKRKKLRYQLDSGHDMAWILLISIGVGMLLTASNGATQLLLNQSITAAQWSSSALAWWFGDSFGILIFGIPLLCWSSQSWWVLQNWQFWLCTAGATIAALVLFWTPTASHWTPTLLFLPLLAVLWAVLRLGLWAVSIQIALIAVLAVIGTISDAGIFANADALTALLSISSYIVSVSVLSYLLVYLQKAGDQTRDYINSALTDSGLGLWQLDLERNSLFFYGEAEQMLGYQRGELGIQFSHWTALLHPDDLKNAQRAMVNHLKGNTDQYQVEFRMQHRAGHYLWILSQGRVVERDAEGRARRLVGSNADITALKDADLEVNRLKDFYASILSLVVTGVWVADTRHRLIFVNQGLCRLMSTTESTLLNKQLLTDFPEHALAQLRPFYYRALHGLTPVQFDAIPIGNGVGEQAFISGWLVPIIKEGAFAGMIGTADDITRQQQYEQQIIQLAFVDQLTQLPNRAALGDKAREMLTKALQQQQQLAVYQIDLDHFQHINDTMGHDIGDQLLKLVAQRLQLLLNPQDLLSRPGGDEFLLIRACRSEHDVLQLAHQLILLMAEPFAVEDRQLQVSPSIGIALFPQHGLNFAELQRMAEIALYAAKAAGRNRYSLYHVQMSEALHEKLQLEHGMRSGLYAGQFSLHYQPIQQLQSGQFDTVEALLRWQHPQLGAISPMRFIPLAEQSGFINELGDWVLQQALKQQARWREHGLDLKVAVNISTVQLRHPDFYKRLQQLLISHGVPGETLELELTESVFADQVSQSQQLLQQIRSLGVTLALDDFGTGYSSLAYLKNFPINKLKIDRSFIADLLTDPDDRAIVHSVVVLGHSLGMQVLAEGVEHKGQLQQLELLSIDAIQGYLLSKPLDAQSLENWLRQVHSLGLTLAENHD